jgi:hypothetical protein
MLVKSPACEVDFGVSVIGVADFGEEVMDAQVERKNDLQSRV